MEYVKLGHTGLDVSPLCLGCMGFGEPGKWIHPWVLDRDKAEPVILKALEAGINFFDTANVYSAGTSEEILGAVLKKHAARDRIVVATKVSGQMAEGPNGSGLSRKALFSEIDRSLTRLDMDYVDLYLIHRWDDRTPIEETLEALHDIVKAGKVRYLGASSMPAWQFQKGQNLAEKNGWTRFAVMQNHYNLLYREEEREMLPYCRDAKVAVTPYSPLASGRLVRDPQIKTSRSETDLVAKGKYDNSAEKDQEVVDRVFKMAADKGVSRVALALAWLLHKKPVVAPLIGATRVSHIEDALPAVDLVLAPEEISWLEEPYVPHPVSFFK